MNSAIRHAEPSTWTLDLRTSPAEREALLRTCHAFAQACEHVRAVGRREGTAGSVRLQSLCYVEVRERFALQANLAVRAVARAASVLKGVDGFPAGVDRVDYDARALSIVPENRTVSLATVSGRLRRIAAEARDGRWPANGAFRRATLIGDNGGFVLLVWGDPDRTVTLPRRWS